jgi:hypothetical protein
LGIINEVSGILKELILRDYGERMKKKAEVRESVGELRSKASKLTKAK